MNHHSVLAGGAGSRPAHLRSRRGSIRILTAKEGSLLFDHLLRLDGESRHDRFNGYVDHAFVARYAAKSIDDGTVIVAYIEDGKVRGAAELHQPNLKPGALPEIAFSVETGWRREGLGSLLFARLIETARSLGYRELRITTGSQNDAMRALAAKFGAKLTFRQGESSGTIVLADAKGMPDVVDAWNGVGRAWAKAISTIYGQRSNPS